MKITEVPEATLWAELVRRSVEREKNGEDSPWPKVTLDMAYGNVTIPADDAFQRNERQERWT